MPNQKPDSLHKPELAENIARRTKLTRAQANEVITAFTDQISAAMARGETVSLTGFGSFNVRQRQARTGRNPQTGETISIPAHRTVGFRAGKSLRDALDQDG